MRKLICILTILLTLTFIGCKQADNVYTDTSETEADETKEHKNNTQARYILMVGGKFVEDWFVSWGWKEGEVMTMERFSMQYVKADTRSTILSDIESTLDQMITEEKDLVYVQLPANFFVGDEDAEDFLEKNKVLVEDIHKLVSVDHNMKIIFGNTLPSSVDDTDIYLVWSHQQFNGWLKDFWRDHAEDVSIFNVYDLTSNEVGTLPEDMMGVNDEYLNKSAYKFLDEKYFDMLENVY